jgi:hypothetical protein
VEKLFGPALGERAANDAESDSLGEGAVRETLGEDEMLRVKLARGVWLCVAIPCRTECTLGINNGLGPTKKEVFDLDSRRTLIEGEEPARR